MSLCGDMMFTESSFHMEEAADIVAVMQRQEATTYRRSDYLAGNKYVKVVDGTVEATHRGMDVRRLGCNRCLLPRSLR
jgi:hypothetical protein